MPAPRAHRQRSTQGDGHTTSVSVHVHTHHPMRCPAPPGGAPGRLVALYKRPLDGPEPRSRDGAPALGHPGVGGAGEGDGQPAVVGDGWRRGLELGIPVVGALGAGADGLAGVEGQLAGGSLVEGDADAPDVGGRSAADGDVLAARELADHRVIEVLLRGLEKRSSAEPGFNRGAGRLVEEVTKDLGEGGFG